MHGLSSRRASLILIACLALVSVSCIALVTPNRHKQTKRANSGFKKPIIMDTVREDIRVEYYDIRGTTAEELNQQMSEMGPGDSDGNWFAKTNWAIDWDYPIPKGDSCEPVQVIIWIQYILPRWIDKNEAPAELQARWDVYELQLKKHEEHHKDIVVKYGQQFITEIKKIDDYNSCKELEERIGAIHAQGIIINACTQEQVQYDQDTNHGVTEGVIL